MYLYVFRMHGTAIGQVLLDAGYIEDVMDNEGDFLDGNFLYRFCSVLPNQLNKNVKSKTTNSKIYGGYIIIFISNMLTKLGFYKYIFL